MGKDVEELGMEPSPEAVDQWLSVHQEGWQRHVVGKSFLGEDLMAYSLSYRSSSRSSSTSNNNNNNATTTTTSQLDGTTTTVTILLISLTHGNEVVGLLALLSTVAKLSDRRNNNNNKVVRIVIFPIVNVDAYRANLAVPNGCRRTNLHPHRRCDAVPAKACPAFTRNGVDLNRNYPERWLSLSWQELTDPCQPNHPGSHPFSEPETRAMRHLVELFSPTFFLSFHSRSGSGNERILIHPYASDRPIQDMDEQRRINYQLWTKEMNEKGTYQRIGTAQHAINYVAGGTTLDWLDSIGVYSLVAEVVPPTQSSRWCHNNTKTCWMEAHLNADAALRWIDIAEREGIFVAAQEQRHIHDLSNQNQQQQQQHHVLWTVIIIVLILGPLLLAYLRYWWWYPALQFSLRKLFCRKEKLTQNDHDDEVELRGLLVQ